MQPANDAPSQNPQSRPPSFQHGERVLVRGARWRVDSVRSYPRCDLLTLTGVEAGNRASRARLLTPFDRPRRVGQPRPAFVSARRGRLALAALAAERELRCAAGAGIDLFPHQLVPALTLLRGDAMRLLIADEAGLGKTIQAGLSIAELVACGRAARVLILTPAGLREQWAGELAARFRLDAQVVDAAALRRRVASLPRSVNPWRTWPVAIASTDFVKRPEVLGPILAAGWDLLVVDEAHGVAVAPDRHAAVTALARRTPYLLLLSATPHNGDDGRYASLMSLGRFDKGEDMLVVRRTRKQAGIRVARRVHLIAVRLSEEERRMHRLLVAYTRRVVSEARRRGDRDALLAMIVLSKRALSGPAALLRSLERRLDWLASADRPTASQIALPLDPESDSEVERLDEAPDGVLGHPGLDEPDEERAWLQRLRAAAAAGLPHDSKLRVLAKLLTRIRDHAIVFTEYRDTLAMLRQSASAFDPLVLHGGLDARERAQVAGEFQRGGRRLLLATDVAAEGLNLQANCRIVVSLELPWTPSRLEQRIGRVDRIGQLRTVHAFNMLARGTAETDVLARLVRRLESIRRRLGDVATPIGRVSDEAILDAVVDARRVRVPTAADPPAAAPNAAAAHHEASEAERHRRLWQSIAGPVDVRPTDVISSLDGSAPWLTIGCARTASADVVAVFRARIIHGVAAAFDEVVIALLVRAERRAGESPRALIRRVMPSLRAVAQQEAAIHAGVAEIRSRRWREALSERLTAIVADSRTTEVPAQQELFRRMPVPDRSPERTIIAVPPSGLPSFEPPELLLIRITPR